MTWLWLFLAWLVGAWCGVGLMAALAGAGRQAAVEDAIYQAFKQSGSAQPHTPAEPDNLSVPVEPSPAADRETTARAPRPRKRPLKLLP